MNGRKREAKSYTSGEMLCKHLWKMPALAKSTNSEMIYRHFDYNRHVVKILLTNRWKMKYTELFTKFTQAVDWFEKEGLSVQRSRVYHYQSELEKLSGWAAENSIKINAVEKGVHYWRSILYEVYEIYEIYSSLKDMISQDIARRLEKISKGPLFLADELVANSSNAPRNYQFELLMASRLKKDGLDIFLDDKNDLVIGFTNGFIPIECKRLQSTSQVEKRIKKGCSQIKLSFNNLPTGRMFPGILILGIEKLDSQHEMILVASSVEKAKQGLGKRCYDFHHKYIDRVKEKGLTHVGGLIVSSNTMSEISGYLQYGSFWTASYWADQQVADHIRVSLGTK